MANNLQRLIDGTLGIRLVSALGRLLPLPLGHALADLASGWITSQRDSALVRAVRANQWVVRGESLDKTALDQAVRETLRHSAHCLYTQYHTMQDPAKVNQLVVPDEATRQFLQRSEFERGGLVIIGLHTSNFDLALQFLCFSGLKAIILTLPDPQGGRRLEMEMRRRTQMNLVPTSVESLRQSIKYLQAGGSVVTGIDRPVKGSKTCPRFFGRPANLPTHHVFLAAKARVPAVLIATILHPDGKYHIHTSPLIEMEQHPNREKETILNAEKVLSIAEDFIRPVPQQWSISLPVWPETLDLVPE